MNSRGAGLGLGVSLVLIMLAQPALSAQFADKFNRFESRASLVAQKNPHSADSKIEGVLRPTVEAGGWTVVDSKSGKKYLLLGAARYEKLGWFKSGARVRVEGTVRPDVATFYMEGTPFQVSKMMPAAGRGKRLGITGTLSPAREAGGWLVTDSRTGQKYHLLEIDRYRGRGWFAKGATVKIDGEAHSTAGKGVEGLPLSVNSMQPG